ncbi:hypothetical protein ACFFX1_32750 [Dactylosporangium sucinum]|uniref:Uncharacterized protein n=1 Tax=Dactylosporangium sucinum TaxID=1424081 RepID=A0A917WKH3_9ACTN|nr:hypothetical protein [Dactylosporangium sucinum]GGM12446.1 hypothetical protein GCM10007977_012060 [Dactylosporangium sucinum]
MHGQCCGNRRYVRLPAPPPFTRGPDLVKFDLPPFEEARLSTNELNDVKPTEYRADAVVTLHDERRTVLAVV